MRNGGLDHGKVVEVNRCNIGINLHVINLLFGSCNENILDFVLTGSGLFVYNILQKLIFTTIVEGKNVLCNGLVVFCFDIGVLRSQICKLGIHFIIQSHQEIIIVIVDICCIYNRIEIIIISLIFSLQPTDFCNRINLCSKVFPLCLNLRGVISSVVCL